MKNKKSAAVNGRRDGPGTRRKREVPPEVGLSSGASAELVRSKQTVRRLRTQLARARRQIEELQASAETDFLLEVLNRRGFERELNRSIAYIKRYRASGALIMLDVDRLKTHQRHFRACGGRSGIEGDRRRADAPGAGFRRDRAARR